MKKLYQLAGLLLIATLILIGYQLRPDQNPSTSEAIGANQDDARAAPFDRGTADSSRTHPARLSDRRGADSEDEITALREELDSTKAELERVTRPLEHDVLSSTVNAELSPGKTLVTGGYKTADGNYELTFLTPKAVTLEDGREAIEMSSNVLSAGAEFVESHGLGHLATNARNTLQHAEAWGQGEVTKTLTAASRAEGTQISTSPKVITLPSSEFAVTLGETSGAQFSFEGTVAHGEDGRFAIRSRVERIPAMDAGEARSPGPIDGSR